VLGSRRAIVANDCLGLGKGIEILRNSKDVLRTSTISFFEGKLELWIDTFGSGAVSTKNWIDGGLFAVAEKAAQLGFNSHSRFTLCLRISTFLLGHSSLKFKLFLELSRSVTLGLFNI
jgi:hypothetical protein